MLWLETSVIVLLFVLIVLGVLTVIFAGRRQVLPPSLTVEENVVTLEGMGKGRNENGQIRKRKVGGAPDVEGIEEFMVIAEDAARKPVRSHPVQERTEETVSTPTEEEKDDLTISLLHSTPNTEDTEKLNDDTQDKERKNKEKKPLPQSQPLPQPHTEAEPIQTAQDVFLASCQNASKCAECDQTFTLLFRRHHCRKCFHSVCASCSVNFVSLPGFGEPVRVCTSCSRQLSATDQQDNSEEEPTLLVVSSSSEDEEQNADPGKDNPASPSQSRTPLASNM